MNKTEKLIAEAEKLWSKLHASQKRDDKYGAALTQLESAIAELYKVR